MKSSRTPSFPEQAQPAFSGRTNMVGASSETWRPQLFAATTTPLSLFLAKVRRFFDIQAGSAWRDLSAVLPSLEGTVLDVGCGAQPFRSMVNPQATYSGIDTDAAKAHFGYEVPNTTYFSGDVWPIADASVNVVLCTETLEHVLETRRFLAEAARSLAPGGTLLLTVPFAARWHFIPHDYWRFTPSSLNHLLTTSGFHKVRVYSRGNALTVACYKVMTLILLLLMPQNTSNVSGLLLRLAGTLFLPLFVSVAIVANLSLLGPGGDDCLGYTVFAVRAVQPVDAIESLLSKPG
jgi:2-polyprenyl-3-methyl-5-hydroxy-6-metoxy-1,4-benzoquinol methylase